MKPGDFVRCINEKVDPRRFELGLILNAVYRVEEIADAAIRFRAIRVDVGRGVLALCALNRFVPWEPLPGDGVIDQDDPYIGIVTTVLSTGARPGYGDTVLEVDGKPYGLDTTQRFGSCHGFFPVLGKAPAFVSEFTWVEKELPQIEPTESFRTPILWGDRTERLRTLENTLSNDPCPDPAMVAEYRLLTSGEAGVSVE